LGIISLTGGFVILFMGYESIRTKGVELNLTQTTPKSLTKGILVNALSPHPYLFWLSVGAPTTTRAMGQSVRSALAFICSFYMLLVGSKIILAILIGKSKSFLAGNVYIYTMRFLVLLLCVLAIILFGDGLKLLGIL
jgi:threonine/homoserine/homoserine lactone efflux protein